VREGAADKTAIQLVEAQPRQLPMSDVKRRHCLGRATDRVLRGVNGPAARRFGAAVGATRGPSECRSLKRSE
jgi:hypothetical protein